MPAVSILAVRIVHVRCGECSRAMRLVGGLSSRYGARCHEERGSTLAKWTLYDDPWRGDRSLSDPAGVARAQQRSAVILTARGG
jgi:hypothetical protein